LAGTDFTIEPTAEVTAAAAPDLRALHLVMAWALILAVTVYPGPSGGGPQVGGKQGLASTLPALTLGAHRTGPRSGHCCAIDLAQVRPVKGL